MRPFQPNNHHHINIHLTKNTSKFSPLFAAPLSTDINLHSEGTISKSRISINQQINNKRTNAIKSIFTSERKCCRRCDTAFGKCQRRPKSTQMLLGNSLSNHCPPRLPPSANASQRRPFSLHARRLRKTENRWMGRTGSAHCGETSAARRKNRVRHKLSPTCQETL